jgi:hypothetical protein
MSFIVCFLFCVVVYLKLWPSGNTDFYTYCEDCRGIFLREENENMPSDAGAPFTPHPLAITLPLAVQR